jgi:hypothetical protein
MMGSGFPRPSGDTRGFTLISVLGTIAVKAYTEGKRRSYDAQTIAFVRNLLTAVETDPPKTYTMYSGENTLDDYPQLQLNRDMKLQITDPALDGENKIQFYVAHRSGALGFYFWIPGPSCTVDQDTTVVDWQGNPIAVPPDKIVPDMVTRDDYNWSIFRAAAGY